MHYIDRQQHRISENLLPSGDFENVRLFSEDGWQRDTVADSAFYSTADLVNEPATATIRTATQSMAIAQPVRHRRSLRCR